MNFLRPYKDHQPQIGKYCYIDATAVLVGQISIGNDCSIWPLVAARGDVNFIRIGERTNIQDGSILHVGRKTQTKPQGAPLIIGDDVTVGHKALLHGCTIGDRVLVGMGSIVLDHAELGSDLILGAGSLVPMGKKLESGYLYFGNPVKQIRALTEDELSFLSESAQNYLLLKDEYLSNMV